MSKESIKKNIQQLRKRIKESPRVWKFRGRLVVPIDNWEPGDWTKLPNEYHIAVDLWLLPPNDWWEDYITLLTKLEAPLFGQMICTRRCAIKHAQEAKKEIERDEQHWAKQGGEQVREEFYKTCGEATASDFRREDGMRKTEFRLYNETAGAKNCTCEIINYFRCPYGNERDQLTEAGYNAFNLWEHVQWYDKHWNRSHSYTIFEPERKWFHWDEPGVIDVTNLEDIQQAINDGRLHKIITEHERYEKENQ